MKLSVVKNVSNNKIHNIIASQSSIFSNLDANHFLFY